jgi:hypothetical protein
VAIIVFRGGDDRRGYSLFPDAALAALCCITSQPHFGLYMASCSGTRAGCEMRRGGLRVQFECLLVALVR